MIFFHFLLDKVFSKNLCKSLVIKDLRGAGMPAPRNSLTLRELRCFLRELYIFHHERSHSVLVDGIAPVVLLVIATILGP